MRKVLRRRMGERRLFLLARGVLAGVLLGFLGAGCAGGPKPVGFCMDVQADQDINFFDGQPHVVVLTLYPLSSKMGFDESTADQILDGALPDALVGPKPLPSRTVLPGQRFPVDVELPPNTLYVGALADYYQASGSQRTQVLAAECGWRGRPTLFLTRNGLRKN